MNKFTLSIIAVCLVLLVGAYFIFSNQNGGQSSPNINMPQPKPTESSGKLPFPIVDKTKNYQAVVTTSLGDITIRLNVKDTPVTVSNFIYLAKKGFYDNTIFHRVIKGFMIQGGDPKGDGTGGPGYRFADEPFTGDYTRGTVAMANAGPDTNGSQFFIMQADNLQMPKNYVIFGKVVAGMDTVDKIADAPVKANPDTGEVSTPVTPVTVKKVIIEEK